jgi:hypothetical protein
MKKLFIFISISLGIFILGAISFSISKAKKWAKHFGMSYFEFAYQLSRALKLLQNDETVENIMEMTGIDFDYDDIKKYFLSDAYYTDAIFNGFNFSGNDDSDNVIEF